MEADTNLKWVVTGGDIISELKETASKCRREIEENPRIYENHIKLIATSRELYLKYQSKLNLEGEEESIQRIKIEVEKAYLMLSNARNKFMLEFPLSVDLAVEWVNDELNRKEKMNTAVLDRIFERAPTEYLSCSLWLMYISYVTNTKAAEEREVRKVYETAVMYGGRHYIDGLKLWKSFTKFELDILASLYAQVKEEKDDSDDDCDSDENIRSIVEIIPPTRKIVKPSIKWQMKEEPDDSQAVIKYKKQLARVIKLYTGVLAVPLQDLEELYLELLSVLETYKVSEKEANLMHIRNSYNKAVLKTKKIEEYENMVDLSPPEEKLKAYLKYINYESKEGGCDPATLQCLFERAIAECCLEPVLWICYLDFVRDILKNTDLLVQVYNRAVRNITWDSSVALKLAYYYEHRHSSKSLIRGAYEDALKLGEMNFITEIEYAKIWMAYISYERRLSKVTSRTGKSITTRKGKEKVNSLIRQAFDHMEGISASDECIYELLNFWTGFEEIDNNIGKVLQIWLIYVEKYNTSQIIWTAAINFAKRLSDKECVRNLYSSALDQLIESNRLIGISWLNFERVHGTFESYIEVEDKLIAQSVIDLLNTEMGQTNTTPRTPRQRTEDDLRDLTERRNALFKYRLPEEGESHSETESSSSNSSITSEDSEDDTPEFRIPGAKPNVVPEGENQPASEGNYVASDIIGPQLVPAEPGETENQPAQPAPTAPSSGPYSIWPIPSGTSGEKTEIGTHGSLPKRRKVVKEEEDSEESKIVYVGNLIPNITISDLSRFFSAAGTIFDIKVQKSTRGVFAFVTFLTAAEAKLALQLEHRPLRGRPVFVSKYHANRNTRPSAVKSYSKDLEKTKLFVSNLPANIEERDLEFVFNRLDNMKSIRLIKKKGSGKSFAYVEYYDEESAANALMETNGRIIKGLTIQVQISNPKGTAGGKSLGESSKQAGKVIEQKEKDPKMTTKPVIRKASFTFVPSQVRKTQGPAQRLEIHPIPKDSKGTSTASTATVTTDTASTDTVSTDTVSTATVPTASVSTDTISTASVSKDTVSTDTVSTAAVPTDTASTATVSTDTVPTDTASTDTVSTAAVPTDTVSTDTVSTASVSKDTVSTDTISKETSKDSSSTTTKPSSSKTNDDFRKLFLKE